VRGVYKTSALGELREGKMVSGNASKKVGLMRQWLRGIPLTGVRDCVYEC
jgi:hypothetical protein